MKILVAEDTPSAQLLLKRILEKWDHQVVCVSDGAEAFEVIQKDREISLIIADWMMPEMDGIELCKCIRSEKWDRYIYVIMLTALTAKADIAKGMEAGADDYATKPLDQWELKARIKAAKRVLDLEHELSCQVRELEESIKTIRKLKELLPICTYCKKIRTDDNYWQQIEEYIFENTGTDFSHGICEDCYENVVKPDLEALKKKKKDSAHMGN